LVLRLVKAHDGELTIENEIYQGTTVRVTLLKKRVLN
jgi:signal transduction histidine kinase